MISCSTDHNFSRSSPPISTLARGWKDCRTTSKKSREVTQLTKKLVLLMTAGIFKQTDFTDATTKWRSSVAHKALQHSKPTKGRGESCPKLLATWRDDLDLAKLKFLESTDFPCQRVVPDRWTSVKRLLAFLYYHVLQEREREDG